MSDECFRPSVSASSDIDNQEIFDYYDDEEEEDDEPGLVLGPFRRVESEELIQHPAASSQPPRQNYKVVKQWLFGAVLGEGSYAKVKEVLHVDTLERAAVKIIKKRRLRKIINGEQNVKAELQLLRRLHHKNVIHLIDFHYNPDKEKIYIFMEHCVITLQDLLDTADHKRLPTHQTHRYFLQLVDGLDYLHDARVIHKDIKPGNLLLTRAQILKISDFGVAEELDKYTAQDICYQSTGTPRFQAPEIAAGLNSFKGTASDIWAAAVTLFNCITGLYPFNGDNIYHLYEKIEKCELTIPSMPELTNDLETLLRGMLLKDFNARFTLAQIRGSVWFKRRHPPLTVDHFEQVTSVRRELNNCSTTCFAALCHMHGQEAPQMPLESEDTFNHLDILGQIDRMQPFSDRIQSSMDVVHYSEQSLVPTAGQIRETQSEAGDHQRRSRAFPLLRLKRSGQNILRTLRKKMF